MDPAARLLRIALTAALALLALIGPREAQAEHGTGFDFAYLSGYELSTTSFGIGSMGMIVNTGNRPLDLSQLRLVSISDDHPQARAERYFPVDLVIEGPGFSKVPRCEEGRPPVAPGAKPRVLGVAL